MPDWAEQVTAIATAVNAIGILSAIALVVYAAQQAREARVGRQAEMAIEFDRGHRRHRGLSHVRPAGGENARRLSLTAPTSDRTNL
jgi:hypothetical protein